MKTFFPLQSVSGYLISAVLLTAFSCSTEEPSLQDKLKSDLLGLTWSLKDLKVDGVDQTTMYSGMTLQFTATTYTTTNGGVVWPATGTWSFKSPDGTNILRNDGLELIVSVVNGTLQIEFTWPERTLGAGRTESLKGNHIFMFVL
jgi:hypothetical protein